MNADTAKVQALKDIAKELHEINRKLDRMCNSDFFAKHNKEGGVGFFTIDKEILQND